MKEIDFETISSKELSDHSALTRAYKAYLKDVLMYSRAEAEMVATDLANPYDTEYIMFDYDDDYTIDGIEYEVRYCYTDFCACGLFHLADVKPFDFYMLFDKSTMPDHTVGSYQDAKKLYVIPEEYAVTEEEEEEETERAKEDECKCTACGKTGCELTVINDVDHVCQKCLDNDYVLCDECGEYWLWDAIRFFNMTDGRTLCEYCAEDEDEDDVESIDDYTY